MADDSETKRERIASYGVRVHVYRDGEDPEMAPQTIADIEELFTEQLEHTYGAGNVSVRAERID